MFKYVAKSKTGEVVINEIDAPSRETAIQMINAMGLYPVTVNEVRAKRAAVFKRIKKKQLAIMLRQFSTMINASIPIPVILTVLKEDERNPALRELLDSIHKDVVEGKSLSSSMAGYPKYFTPFMVNMVEMGETNGKLDMAFERIATATEKEMKVAGKAKSALIYPTILLTLAIGMTIFLSVKVVPTFAQLFIDFGSELPGITKLLLAISDFLQGYWYIVIILIVGLIVGLKVLWSKRNSRKHMERVFRKIPIIKSISDAKIMGKYSRVMSSMLDSGVAIVKALTITKGSLQNVTFEESFENVIQEVKTGSPIHQAVDNTKLFTPLVVSMTRIGEESGKIGELLNNTAEFYEEETERKISAAMSILEPVITIVLGVIIAFIVASIILPMFDMYSVIG